MPLITGRSEIDNLDDRTLEIFEEDILGLEIAMDQPGLVQKRKAIEKLLCKHTHQRGAKSSELVLLDQLVQVDTQ